MYRVLTFLVFFTIVNAKYTYTTNWFEVPLDHFSFQRNETFKVKYLVNDTHWDQDRGPIFFYTGNEGQIETFAQHTGFMWDIAEEYQAKLVFAEHRYYGASMPFGNKSLDREHTGYMTASQALADYALIIDSLQGGHVKPKYPVVVFGGSYGGMLAAYFRIKYPHIAVGAIAASAPVHMFPGMVPCEAFHRILTSSFKVADEQCVENIKRSWPTLRNFTKQANSSEWLKKNWRLCEPPVKSAETIENLFDFLKDMYVTLGMVNYPFPSDFLMPLPANPVRVACQYLNKPLSGEKLLQAVGKVLELFTNYDKNNKCVDYNSREPTGNLDSRGWGFQACTEMVMPMCTTGIHDMFEPSPWNFTNFADDCHKRYGVYPRPDAARIEYGGDRLQGASNIVFSNGLLDPWAGGGILSSVGQEITAVVIIGAAHHLDLMAATDVDPVPVRMARNVHKQKISQWIADFRDGQKAHACIKN